MKFTNLSAIIVLLGICSQEHVVTQAVRLGEHQATVEFAEALRHHQHHHQDDAKTAAAKPETPESGKTLKEYKAEEEAAKKALRKATEAHDNAEAKLEKAEATLDSHK